jgi:LemA protein
MEALMILAGVLLVPIIIYVVIYNGLVTKKNRVEQAFAGVDVQLKKRFDLVPNLVTVVKQYMKHEAETLTKLTQQRAKALAGSAPTDQRIDLENQITRAIGGVMVTVENYPQLKADVNFRHLPASLNEIEEQISAARRAYNAAVLDLNNAVEMFPSNIVASTMGCTRRQSFEIPTGERENVNVQSMLNS